MDSTLKILSVFTTSQFHDFLIDLQMSSTPLLLSIDEIEGNTTAISQHIPSTGVGGPRTTLREKVYCVLGANNYLHTPVHTQSFNPRHISALTLQLRTYNPTLNVYTNYTGQKVGLWFKLTTDDC